MKLKMFILFCIIKISEPAFGQNTYEKVFNSFNDTWYVVPNYDTSVSVFGLLGDVLNINQTGNPSMGYFNWVFQEVTSCASATSDTGYLVSGQKTFYQSQRSVLFKSKLMHNGYPLWYNYTDLLSNKSEFNLSVQANDSNIFTCGVITDTITNEVSLYVTKSNSTGITQLSKIFESTEMINIYQLIATPDNGFLVAGYFFGDGATLIKFDSSCSIVWSKLLNIDACSSVRISYTGDYLVAGHNSGSSDVYVSKIDTSGNVIWAKLYPHVGGQVLPKAIEMNDHSIVVLTQTVTTGYSEAHLIRLDSLGDFLYAKRFPNTTSNRFHFADICETADNMLCVVGTCDYNQQFVYRNFTFKLDSLFNGCNFLQDTFQIQSLILSPVDIILSSRVASFPSTTVTPNTNSITSNSVNVCIPSAISEKENTIDLLYPNPASDHLSISLPENFKAQSIEVFNSLGQKVLFKEFDKSQDHELNIPISLPQGIYFGKIVSTLQALSFSFVVE